MRAYVTKDHGDDGLLFTVLSAETDDKTHKEILEQAIQSGAVGSPGRYLVSVPDNHYMNAVYFTVVEVNQPRLRIV